MDANTLNTGLFSLNEFTDRIVTKLAPDSFVAFMGQTEIKIAVGSSSANLNMKSGLTAVNSTCSNVPGGGVCNITMSCPQYDSLNQSYFITQPDGTKVPFFTAMMEVRVYSKGRFLNNSTNAESYAPMYYPTFWGFVLSVGQNYNGSETTFSLSCVDMLQWWERQVVNVNMQPGQAMFGGGRFQANMSTFRYMNPWEIILNLFKDTSFSNFVFPSVLSETGATVASLGVSKFFQSKGLGDNGGLGTYQALAESITSDWVNRFGMGKVLSSDSSKLSGVSNLEMFGVAKVIKISDAKNSAFTEVSSSTTGTTAGPNEKIAGDPYDASKPSVRTNTTVATPAPSDSAKASPQGTTDQGDTVLRAIAPHLNATDTVDMNFGILGKVMPYGDYTNAKAAVPDRMSKLEIAARVASDIGFEFYQDTNGMFVFKPPFFNMDTSRNPVYVIKPSEILNFDENVDASVIVTYVRATGPAQPQVTQATFEATHFDMGLIRQFGIKEQTLKLNYGYNPAVVRAAAAGEMSRSNAKAYSANLTIPMRAEIRVGYPVYIEHLDSYYYVKQVSHAFAFGGTATTSLILEAKRSKVFDSKGTILKGYIYKAVDKVAATDNGSFNDDVANGIVKKQYETKEGEKFLGSAANVKVDNASKQWNHEANYFSASLTPADKYMRVNNLISSPDPGDYTPMQSDEFKAVSKTTSDATAVGNTRKDIADGVLSDLVMFTTSTLPYTDVNGYQHIGGFPFGATLVLTDTSGIQPVAAQYSGGIGSEVFTKIKPAQESNTPRPMDAPSSVTPAPTDQPSSDGTQGGAVASLNDDRVYIGKNSHPSQDPKITFLPSILGIKP